MVINYTLLIVMIGTTLLGIASGLVGTFAVLRKESLIGDGLAHAALPGVALAFFTNRNKRHRDFITRCSFFYYTSY